MKYYLFFIFILSFINSQEIYDYKINDQKDSDIWLSKLQYLN